MKSEITIPKSCNLCENKGYNFYFYGNGYGYRFECNITGKSIPNINEIANWCPQKHRAEIELEINRRKFAIKNTKDTFNL